MSKMIVINCPYCSDENIVDTELYPGKLGLHYICEMKNCEMVFGFDLEEMVVAVTYKVTHQLVQ